MIDEEVIRKLIEKRLAETALFVTELTIMQGNNIQVFIDGDQGVSINDCVALSRHIESNLDRDQEDFKLQVSSAGVDRPLQFPRQYVKNVGRRFSIELKDESNISGALLAAEKDKIQVQTEIKKGRKIIPGNIVEINYKDISIAICLTSFK